MPDMQYSAIQALLLKDREEWNVNETMTPRLDDLGVS